MNQFDSFFKSSLFLLLSFCFVNCITISKKPQQNSNKETIEKHSNLKENNTKKPKSNTNKKPKPIILGIQQTEKYLPILKSKKIAIVANPTTAFPTKTHLVDSLKSLKVNITKVFSPEHGFRGKADAGETVSNGKDIKSGLPIISLYGKHKKPTQEDMQNIDVMIFDLQDVGVRCYTYISTLHYIMESCSQNNIPLVILDRPNPNGHFVDGMLLEKEYRSFVGMHPVPLVHGMTIGEYAQMINGEKWLKNKIKCDLYIIQMKNYDHNKFYHIPIKPSPNLPNDKSIALYPSLCLFEGTTINAGRGTSKQFQQFGASFLDPKYFKHKYKPVSMPGAKYPKEQNKYCYGKDLSQIENPNAVNLAWLIEAYQNCNNKDKFFNTKNFTIHAGTKKLQQQIQEEKSFQEIKDSWQDDLTAFRKIRKQYLIYDD